MKKLCLLAMATLTACGGSGAFQDQARDSLPDKSSVAMKTPGGTSAGLTRSTSLSANATSNDAFYGLTVQVAVAFNVPVAGFLDIIATVAALPPTSCTATSCTWGPGSAALDPNNYELTITKDPNDGASFDWTFSGQAKSRPGTAFITVASGIAKPGGDAHHGSGSFSMDFEAAKQLDGPHNGGGKLTVSAYNNVGPASLSVSMVGSPDSNVPTQLDNLAYAYAEDATGGGDMQFAVHNTTTGADFSVHSRWKNDGSGRADVEGESGTGFAFHDSDCWGVAPFAQVYFTSDITTNSPPFVGPTTGSVTACAYPDPAVYSTLTAQ